MTDYTNQKTWQNIPESMTTPSAHLVFGVDRLLEVFVGIYGGVENWCFLSGVCYFLWCLAIASDSNQINVKEGNTPFQTPIFSLLHVDFRFTACCCKPFEVRQFLTAGSGARGYRWLIGWFYRGCAKKR